MRRLVGTLAAGAALLMTGGCRQPAGFACSGDEQCMNADGVAGQCFSIGACGYPDTACDSGHRYSAEAPQPWTNRCVLPEDPAPTTSPGTNASGESDDGSSGSSTGESDASTTVSIPSECGNGVEDDGELCDDGNEIEADGCNPDCRPSGTLLLSFTSLLGGRDQAEAVVLTEDGDVVIGGVLGESDNRDGFVARYGLDGMLAWQLPISGTAERLDAVWALGLGPSGNVRALGQVIDEAGAKVTPREDYWVAELDVENGSPNWAFVLGEGPPAAERGYAMAHLPKGDILIAGRVGDHSNSDFGIGRYTLASSGKGDLELAEIWAEAFDGGIELRDFARGVAVDATGRVVVGGTMEYVEGDLDRHLRVLDPGGNPFNPPCEDRGTGQIPEADDRILAVAIGPAGEVVAAGQATRATNEATDAWLGYYAPGSCSLEWEHTEPGPGHDTDAFTTVAIDGEGNIVAGGFLNTGNTEDAWLVKFDASREQLWAIDPIDGTGNGNDRIQALVVDENREITVAGRMTRPGEEDAWVARYTP